MNSSVREAFDDRRYLEAFGNRRLDLVGTHCMDVLQCPDAEARAAVLLADRRPEQAERAHLAKDAGVGGLVAEGLEQTADGVRALVRWATALETAAIPTSTGPALPAEIVKGALDERLGLPLQAI